MGCLNRDQELRTAVASATHWAGLVDWSTTTDAICHSQRWQPGNESRFKRFLYLQPSGGDLFMPM